MKHRMLVVRLNGAANSARAVTGSSQVVRSGRDESQWGREFRARCDLRVLSMQHSLLPSLNGAANSARAVTSSCCFSLRILRLVSMGPRIPRAL